MDMTFDRDGLVEAFGYLGSDLASRGMFVELAVHGASALMLQFSWRRGIEGVDVVLRPGYDDPTLAPSVSRVAAIMGLSGEWLSDAFGMLTSSAGNEILFRASGNYPPHGTPGLRVLVAMPHYLMAMRLLALGNANRGDMDMTDARALAGKPGNEDVDTLGRLHASIHDGEPAHDLWARVPSVIE